MPPLRKKVSSKAAKPSVAVVAAAPKGDYPQPPLVAPTLFVLAFFLTFPRLPKMEKLLAKSALLRNRHAGGGLPMAVTRSW